MSVTIPRVEIHTIATRYGDPLCYETDPPAHYIRNVAADYRRQASDLHGATADDRKFQTDLRAEADDLDALVDRIENERDAHCIAYSQDPDTGECVCGHPDDVHAGTLGQCEAPIDVEVTA